MAPESVEGLTLFLAMTGNSAEFAALENTTRDFRFGDGAYTMRFHFAPPGTDAGERHGTFTSVGRSETQIVGQRRGEERHHRYLHLDARLPVPDGRHLEV
jgi:hypothetical protein